jgi:hypothetical protein
MTIEVLAVLLALGAIVTGLRMAWRDWRIDEDARRRLAQAEAARLASDDEFTRSIRDWGHIRGTDRLR